MVNGVKFFGEGTRIATGAFRLLLIKLRLFSSQAMIGDDEKFIYCYDNKERLLQ